MDSIGVFLLDIGTECDRWQSVISFLAEETWPWVLKEVASAVVSVIAIPLEPSGRYTEWRSRYWWIVRAGCIFIRRGGYSNEFV